METRILTMLRRANRRIATLVGIMLLVCAGFVLVDILMRQMGSSLGGTDEISGYVMAIATSWGMSFALIELSHVRIDFLRSTVATKGRVLFDLLAMIVMTGTITLIAFRCWPVLERSIANLSRANTPLETPLWAVQLPWFAGWVWFAVVSWLTLVAALVLFARGNYSTAEATIGVFAENEAAQ